MPKISGDYVVIDRDEFNRWKGENDRWMRDLQGALRQARVKFPSPPPLPSMEMIKIQVK